MRSRLPFGIVSFTLSLHIKGTVCLRPVDSEAHTAFQTHRVMCEGKWQGGGGGGWRTATGQCGTRRNDIHFMLAAGQTHYEKQISCYKDERKYGPLGGLPGWNDPMSRFWCGMNSESGWEAPSSHFWSQEGPGQRVKHWGSRNSPWCSGRDHWAFMFIFNIEFCATRITQALSSSSWHKVSTCFLKWPRPWLSTEVVQPAGLRVGPRPRSLHLLGILCTTWHMTHLLDPILELCCFSRKNAESHGSTLLIRAYNFYHLFSSPYFFQRKE